MNPLLLFGKAADDLASLKTRHPDLNFISLKQIHSDIIIPSSAAAAAPIDGDALWSSRAGEALCIRTADCVPVLLHCAAPDLIAAAHAGWRGIASNIIGKTIDVLCSQGGEVTNMHVWIGPHIRVESFEVGVEVADKLESVYSTLPSQGSITLAHADPSKRYVNLEKIAIAQLVASGLSPANIHLSDVDTLTNLEYHSFRRDGAAAGRQHSFIAL